MFHRKLQRNKNILKLKNLQNIRTPLTILAKSGTPLTILAKSSTLDAQLGSEYACRPICFCKR